MSAPKNYDHLIGLPGFSEPLLKNHFTLYEGYVANVNKDVEILVELAKEGKANTPMHAEVRRRLGWEWNGMRLHELYFGNMTHAKSAPPPDGSGNANAPMRIKEEIQKHFGSMEDWEKDFRTAATMRGIGWAILYFDPESRELFNVWINEHDMGHLAGGKPLFVLDVFEHAYVLDYGLKRADYIDAFMKVVDWGVVESRFK